MTLPALLCFLAAAGLAWWLYMAWPGLSQDWLPDDLKAGKLVRVEEDLTADEPEPVIGRPDQARVAVANADLRTIAASLEMYRLDNRTYPTTEQGLQALITAPTLAPTPPNWVAGGYLPNVPTDPWGNPYVFRSPGAAAGFDLMSLGADGTEGGEGVDADITLGAAG